MFAYCGNNPTSRIDSGGAFWNIVAGAVIGGLTSFVGSILTDVTECLVEGKEINGETVDLMGACISAGLGAFTGAAVAMCPAAGSAVNSLMGACDALISGVRDNEDTITLLTNIAVSASLGAVTGSWGSDFANVTLLDDAVDAFACRSAGNHPTVKNAATKLIKQAGKFLLGAFSNSMGEDISCSYLEWGTQKILEVIS